MSQILITGGAGFIGSHLADALLAAGHRVRALDNLSPQVHGERRTAPEYLSDEVDLVIGDVRDREAVDRALEGVEVVFHLAAAVGVGARRSAAKSAMVTSVSCPTPTTTGRAEARIARATASSLKDHRSSIEPPPRTSSRTSHSLRALAIASISAMRAAAPSPCTGTG